MKIGVVGVGSMGQNHARVLDKMDCLEGVMDKDKGVADEVGKRFGVPSFYDLDDLLDANYDAISVSTPAHTHLEVCDRVIDRGFDLLVEKPIALSVEDAEKIVGKAEKKGVVLAVGMIERHNPVVGSTKALLDNGNFGDAITISSKRVSSFPGRVSDMGVIFDLAIHDIDIMRYLIGEKVVRVYTLGGLSEESSKYEDHANIMLQFENGVTGVVEVNWLTPHKVRTLSITCSNDYVEVDYINQSLVVTSSQLLEYDASNLFDIPLEHNIRKFSVKRQEPLKREMQDFIKAVKGEHDPLVTGEDGLKSMEVVEAAYKSMKSGDVVRL